MPTEPTNSSRLAKSAPRSSRNHLETAERRSWAQGPLVVSLLGIALFFTSGCSPKEAADQSPTVTVQAAAAEDAPIQRKVTADAILYPRDQAAIVPKITAPVKKFYVDRGSAVHKGQLLAELENQDLVGTVTENQGDSNRQKQTTKQPRKGPGKTSNWLKSSWTVSRNCMTAAKRSTNRERFPPRMCRTPRSP